MRSPARRSRWVFRVSRSSVASSKSASATSIKTRAFRCGRCAATRHSTSWRWMRSSTVTKRSLARCSERSRDLVEQGALRPLPYRAFPAGRIDAAFRLMAGGKHIGKVVVAFATPFVPRRGEPLPAGFEVKPDGSYLITGAFGGYRQSAGAMAGRLRRAPSRPNQPQRCVHSRGRKVCGRLAGTRRRGSRGSGGHWFA